MFDFGFQELLVVLAIVAILFGPSRLPQMGEGVGKLIANLRKNLHESDDEPEADEKSPAIALEAPAAPSPPEMEPPVAASSATPEVPAT